MKVVVRKSFVEEYHKSKNVYVIPLIFSDENFNKSFNAAVHPRDKNGKFTSKNTASLNNSEKKKLIRFLKKEKYIEVDGIKIAEEKYFWLNESLNGEDAHDQNVIDTKHEFEACKQLQKEGYTHIHLLRSHYSYHKNADTIAIKDSHYDFVELKYTKTKKQIGKQYTRSQEQANSVFITTNDRMKGFDRKNLQDYANRMNKTKVLYVWVEGDDKADRIK